ncbi:TonB-dependent receptor plug domain-containing protein [Salegentibacter sediminis]|uniref:TonB-dependent receptor plug domain-containing protein n=1 Tax=Salegentibacter sediminis TaxID=1930251 RepID=UPI0009BF6703|nr:TonB-dependent receptor [Salegentibacter sediminis]
MKRNLLFFAVVCMTFGFSRAQDNPEQPEQLEEVMLTAGRIDLPFSRNSRTIKLISSEEIKNSGANNLADLLQQVTGVDIRRRGTGGAQADLYIRGGSFDQTLLLIDGIKVEDAQTGHHTLNLALPMEVIERIEIIKGPAARVYGQNAFTGAVNIVTKDAFRNEVSIGLEAGSYEQKNASVTVSSKLEKSSHIINYTRQLSDGYRYNTDYDNQQYFIKSNFDSESLPIEMIAAFADRKFGANGFYASPEAVDQYEETQASLLGFSSIIEKGNLSLKPRVYWRRNEDEYIYLRQDPSVYRNLHISNKVGAEVNASYTSNLGVTGFGVDMAKVFLSSNNLGDRERFMTTLFLEHQFKLLNDRLDVTPGLAVNYFSDFKFHAFPGVDVGYQLADKWRAYGNIGYTYRIPTYTDLYYESPNTIGNEDLEPEEAVSEEFGLKYLASQLQFSVALFNRDARNLIDYVKENLDDLWQAKNVRDVNSKGVEANLSYGYNINNHRQHLDLGYTYLKDNIKDLDLDFSQYSINSLRHHFTATYTSQFIKNLSHSVIYSYAERSLGESYSLVDFNIRLSLDDLEIYVAANNIFNTEYTETNLVPMPKGNMLFGLRYNLR